MAVKNVTPMSFMPLSPYDLTKDELKSGITTPTAVTPLQPTKTGVTGTIYEKDNGGSYSTIDTGKGPVTVSNTKDPKVITETLYEDKDGGYITVDDGLGPKTDPGITNLKNILANQKAQAESIKKLGGMFPGLSQSQLEMLFQATKDKYKSGAPGADAVYAFMQDYVNKNFKKASTGSEQRTQNTGSTSKPSTGSSIGRQTTGPDGKITAEANTPAPSATQNTNANVGTPEGETDSDKINSLTSDINKRLNDMKNALASDVKGIWSNVGDMKKSFDTKINLTNNIINQKAAVYQNLFDGLDDKYAVLSANQAGTYKTIMDRIKGYESFVDTGFNEMKANLAGIQTKYRDTVETELAGQAAGAEKELRGKTGKANALRVANTIGQLNQEANQVLGKLDVDLGEKMNALQSDYITLKGQIVGDMNLTDQERLRLDTDLTEKLNALEMLKGETQVNLINEGAQPYKEEIVKQEEVQSKTVITQMVDRMNSEYEQSSPTKRQELITSMLQAAGLSVSEETLENAVKATTPAEATNILLTEIEEKTDEKAKSSSNVNALLEALQGGGGVDPNGATGVQEEGTSGSNSGFKNGARTDRNNNPTAMTTDVARTLGLIEGVDYVVGDKFPGESKLYTAKLLGDPYGTTIKAFDTAITKGRNPFYTQGGAPRWSYLQKDPALSQLTPAVRSGMNAAQKKAVIKKFYAYETPAAKRTMIA